jgi:hypothetical protein
MKKRKDLPLPLKLVKEFEHNFPKCWEYVDFVRSSKGKDLPDWSDLCYIPITGTNEILRNKYNNNDTNVSGLYCALANWRQYKEIYSFSNELYDMLEQQADDIVVPTDILFQIPYPCIYISSENKSEGFFVFFEQDMESMEMELRFTTLERQKNGQMSICNYWLHLKDGYSISDGIKDGIKMIRKNLNIENLKSKVNIGGEILEKTIGKIERCTYINVSKLIQLVLYICAENAEVEENPQQKQITRKPHSGTKPKDTFREIRKWNVGVKISKQIKKAKSEENADPSDPTERRQYSNKNSKRPHTRRGHWHHYWTGSEKDNSRKLILKWVVPTFVGGDKDNIITTINEVE